MFNVTEYTVFCLVYIVNTENHNRSRRTIMDGFSIDATEVDATVSIETRVSVEVAISGGRCPVQ